MTLEAPPGPGQPPTTRLMEVNARLTLMGTTEEYCQEYFAGGAGVCEDECGGICLQHRSCLPPLPPGRMCVKRYGMKLRVLRRKLDIVEGERATLKRQWDEFKGSHEDVENMLTNNESGRVRPVFDSPCPWLVLGLSLACPWLVLGLTRWQAAVQERKSFLRTQILHKHGESRKLLGERYKLLSLVRPVDLESYHRELNALLIEKADLLEVLIMGRPWFQALRAGPGPSAV